MKSPDQVWLDWVDDEYPQGVPRRDLPALDKLYAEISDVKERIRQARAAVSFGVLGYDADVVGDDPDDPVLYELPSQRSTRPGRRERREIAAIKYVARIDDPAQRRKAIDQMLERAQIKTGRAMELFENELLRERHQEAKRARALASGNPPVGLYDHNGWPVNQESEMLRDDGVCDDGLLLVDFCGLVRQVLARPWVGDSVQADQTRWAERVEAVLQLCADRAGRSARRTVLVCESGGTTGRQTLVPGYQLGPKSFNATHEPVYRAARRALVGDGYLELEVEHTEARDVIATLARRRLDEGLRTWVCSDDSALTPMLGWTDDASLLSVYCWAGGGKIHERTRARWVEVFGFAPALYADAAALAGDAACGWPSTISANAANKLVAEFGGLESILQRVAEAEQGRGRMNGRPEVGKIAKIKSGLLLGRKLFELQDAISTVPDPLAPSDGGEVREGRLLVAASAVYQIAGIGQDVATVVIGGDNDHAGKEFQWDLDNLVANLNLDHLNVVDRAPRGRTEGADDLAALVEAEQPKAKAKATKKGGKS